MLCALVLLTLGVVMVQSAGMSVRPLQEDMTPAASAAVSGVSAESLLTSRTSLYLVFAVIAMGIASRLPVRRVADRLDRVVWFRPGGDIGILVIASMMLAGLLALVYVPGIARVEKGSARWLNLHVPGLESVQPSEIVKWALIILVAWYAARLGSYKENKLRRFFSGLMPVCICAGFVAGVVVLEDLGTGALMVFVAGVILLAAGARWMHFGMFIPPVLCGIVFAILAAPYRVQRITAFLDPYADPAGSGYHMIQSIATVAGGGVFGRGLGHGLQKFGYLPEDTTDFLFAVVCEELGLIGAIIVVCAYAGLAWTGTRIAMRETSMMLKLIVLGIIATISMQAMINLVVVTGLGPTKGIALPLMSSGGTGWIMTAFSLGLIVSIDRTRSFLPSYLSETTDSDAELIAIRASRGSEIEAKPGFADRAGLFGAPDTMSVFELDQSPYPDNPIEQDEMEELLNGSSHDASEDSGAWGRFRFKPRSKNSKLDAGGRRGQLDDSTDRMNEHDADEQDEAYEYDEREDLFA